MINIAYVHGNSNVIAGQEKVLIYIAKGIDNVRFQPIVILPEEGIFAQELRKNNIRVEFIGLARFRFKNPLPYFRTVLRLYRFFKKEKIKIVHTSGLFPNQCCVVAAKLAKIPCLCHIHTTLYTKEHIDNSLLRFSDLVITVSRGVKESIEKAHLSKPEIRVVYNGLDPECYKIDMERVKKIREGLGIVPHYKVVGQVGQIIERKGIYYFIKMAELIIKQRKDVRFLFVGDDKYEPGYMVKMQDMVKKSGLSDFIIFTGYREDIPELISVMDITVLCALQEGMALVLVEAALLDRPVVVTDIPGCNEVVENNVTGILVPAKDAQAMAEQVLRLLDDNALAEKLVNNAKRKALSEFSLKRQIKEISDIYEYYITGSGNIFA